MEPAGQTRPAAAGLASTLASRLRALWGTEAEVTGVRPLPGGASRESWDVWARAVGGAERRLILLRDVGDRDPSTRHPDKNVAVEAAAMTAARLAGVPEEIQMRRVAGYLFGFIKPDALKGVTG
jgi:hypothetical protein